MVVTRKKPSAPAPPSSRTSSTQALPRVAHAKPTPSNLSTTSDTHSDSSSHSTKNVPNGSSKSKSKSKRSKSELLGPSQSRGYSFLDRLFLFLLATFAAYAMYTCPSDATYSSPVCHSLATYRTHILEPYILPPVRAAITHPVILQPYEKYAKPVYQNYIQPVTPYVAAAQRYTTPYVNIVIHFSKRTTLRVWEGLIKPYWTRAVVPRYNLYIKPQVNKYVSPITRRAKFYHRRAEPYIRAFAYRTSVYSHKVQQFVYVTYSTVKPHATRTFNKCAPYVSRAYAQVRPLLSWAVNKVQVKGNYLAGEALALSQAATGQVGALRRQYVDPHVLRIWEKAAEKSDSSLPKQTTTVTATPTRVEETETPSRAEDVPVHTEQPTATSSSVVDAHPSPSITPEMIPDVEKDNDNLSAPIDPTPSPTPDETLEKAASVVQESAGHASSMIEEIKQEIRATNDEQVPTKAPVETPEPAAKMEGMYVAAASVTQNSSPSETPTDSEDIDDFLREIGLDDDETSDALAEPEQEPVRQEEDEAAKKAAVVAKRADIVARHVRWQSELDALVKDLEVRVRDDIIKIREAAVKHIGKLPSDKSASEPDGKAREVIDRIQVEGAKLLKGLDGYVTKLSSRQIPLEELEKEKETWAKVAEKVEGKFKDVVSNIQEEVHTWYVGIRENEAAAGMFAAQQIKALAERAQANLGLDYAWLDDVSYNDWQKYHDLLRTYENFEHTVNAIQNGTHTNAPGDELVPVLDKLNQEVQHMITGFAYQMHAQIRQGDLHLRAASEPEPAPDTVEEYDGEGEEEDEVCEDGEEEYESDDEPEVSILPIPPAPDHVDPANIVIGKSKEQVEQAAKLAFGDARDEL